MSTPFPCRFDRPSADAFDDLYLQAGFRRLLPVDRSLESHLRGVIDDVLDHPGSLVRARLAFSILREHGVDAEAARQLAVAIEYFHTASLIFDDLPEMDDAEERRGHTCPHRVHGEAAAMLGALAFINQGYALLWRVLATLPPERNRRAAELVSSCLGVCGILNGQSLDLHFAEDKTGDETGGEAAVLRVAEGKTVTLIRLTLLLPAMVAGIDDAVLERLDRLAAVWGFAYQIADDFKDCLMSEAETGKSTDRDHELGRPSLPRVLGHERADARLADFLAEGRAILDELAADDVFGGGRFSQLETVQSILENEYDRITARRPLARCA